MLPISLTKKCTLLALAASLGACQSQPKQSTPQQPFANLAEARLHFIRPIFSTLDCEHVGHISSGEVDEHFYALYFYIDRDQSRTITEDEFIRAAHNSSEEKERFIFALLDTDQNKLISPLEFRNFTIEAIDQSDLDHDGWVNEREAGIASPNHSH